MKSLILPLLLVLAAAGLWAQPNQVRVVQGPEGTKLTVNGADFMVNGMNWDYFPIGTNYSYSLWTQPDDIIRAALDEEMSLLRNMGVNAIRQYTGVPARWITYIYEKYGIYTMLNHSFGRYGLTIDGGWMANTEYSDPRVRALLLDEVRKMTEEYQNTPGLLMYLLGNENNYGLFWGGAETEDIPIQDRKSTIRAEAMYKLFNEATVAMKGIDQSHPVAMCNGDLLFLDIIARECPAIDIFGTNMYRGVSFGDAFTRVRQEYGKPILFTEFGADAFNAQSNREDQLAQAYYMVGNWKEIYANAAGMGGADNSLGGFTFQFSDGWWKFGQTDNLDVHDNNASWSNGGYDRDYVPGENNMNEEWFGVTAKGPTNERGLYSLYPRAAYYALKEAHRYDPYANGSSNADLDNYFDNIQLMDAVTRARGDQAAMESERAGKIQLSRLSAELTSFNTGGSLIATPQEDDPTDNVFPNQLGFDHMQSIFVGVSANPNPSLRANVEFNILGNVAQNPINEVFYENRGRPVTFNSTNGQVTQADVNRIALYRADINWTHDKFDLTAFYRTGHYHWGYEGDFFGLYPEANYGPNIDIYNGQAPLGVEIEGKKELKGLTLAMGPELWWGANPAILAKYRRELMGMEVTGIFHEDLEERGQTESSFAIPMPRTRRATLQIEKEMGNLGIQLGGIWGGSPLIGRSFQLVEGESGDYTVYQDEIKSSDNWGGKVKLTYSKGRINWYAQAAAQGLVAGGSADPTLTFTGWRLKDSGSGNQYNFLSGFTYLVGNLQIAPNFLWQRPIEGPIPGDVTAPGRPRNILADPFSVRANRETVAGEILFTFDPTPATYMHQWDNDRAEDAKLAVAAGFVFRHLPTTQDAAIGILPDGRTFFAFPGAAPAADLWEAHARIVSKVNTDLGLVANVYTGTAQANGSDPRKIQRFGTDVRLIYKHMKLISSIKFNDWGPFDYHRDFNLTFPTQLQLDLSTTLGRPSWFSLPETKIGVMGIYRTLDQFSPRYCPTRAPMPDGTLACAPTAIGFDNGNEWEIRTYLHINIFK
ncbi:glycoside hydrolase family 2 TIM barrel-domain containing protein [Neolewinella lacunae]|uniref:Glycosidase n=1 Tax=Neolewinella lacunae TaxID=1517758 RepID=A0A923PFZ3_9BACT|nr:glycoside hydrolase family 2 TIM barrel-domain containing protein [Neolewinella lacunae]MBC6993375.1 glycosidase [Neolewinella lacunae]MDN3635167.1 glycoside hydrolase family 2 TIM barrel-domain containing protein [Neolewinella lacunae]